MERNPNSSYMQKLHLEILKQAKWDRLDGDRVARELELHRNLWQAAMLVSYLRHPQLESLYALRFASTSADTLLIATTPLKKLSLYRLAERWNPDVLDWMSQEQIDEIVPIHEEWEVLSATWYQDGRGSNFQNEKHQLKFDIPGGYFR